MVVGLSGFGLEDGCPSSLFGNECVHDGVVPLASGIGLSEVEPVCEFPGVAVVSWLVGSVDVCDQGFVAPVVADLEGKPCGEAGGSDVFYA